LWGLCLGPRAFVICFQGVEGVFGEFPYRGGLLTLLTGVSGQIVLRFTLGVLLEMVSGVSGEVSSTCFTWVKPPDRQGKQLSGECQECQENWN
jgi:hypothetical protein